MAGRMHTLGCQLFGVGRSRRLAAAEAWFKLGVKQHDPEAEFFLAHVGRQ